MNIKNHGLLGFFVAFFVLMSSSILNFCFAEEQKKQLNSLISIPFILDREVNNYYVSGIWYPTRVSGVSRNIVGSATFEFEDKKTKKRASVGLNDISIFHEDELAQLGLDMSKNEDEILANLKSKTKGGGAVTVKVDESNYAHIINCSFDNSMTQSTDKCLDLGHNIVDFQDLNFDNKKEVLFTFYGAAQRGGDGYEVHELEKEEEVKIDNSNLLFIIPFRTWDNGNIEPLNRIDEMSEINLTKKFVAITDSNGASSSIIKYYSTIIPYDERLYLIKCEEGESADPGCGYISTYKKKNTPIDDKSLNNRIENARHIMRKLQK